MFEQTQSFQKNGPILDEDDADSIQMPVGPDELSFSWFIGKVAQQGRTLCRPDSALLQRKDLSYSGHLALAFAFFITAIVVGSVHLKDCSNQRMICIFLIVQGVCGLVVVLVHTAAVVVECKPGSIVFPLRLDANVVKCIFALTYCLVTFFIVWFIFGHLWLIRSSTVSSNGQFCQPSATKVALMLLLYEYLIGIGYVGSRIWNSESILRSLKNVLQRRLDRMGRPSILEMVDSSDEAMDELATTGEPSGSRAAGYDNGISFSQLTSIQIRYALIGVALCAVLLIVLVMSVGSSTAVLPTQCFAYTTLTDSTRLVTYTSCCQDDNSLASGWHRFTGDGGTRLVTVPVSQNYICGSTYPGWWNGTLPVKRGSTNVGNICFYQGGSPCSSSLSPISATNCGDYYVFYLIRPTCCGNSRYCTTA